MLISAPETDWPTRALMDWLVYSLAWRSVLSDYGMQRQSQVGSVSMIRKHDGLRQNTGVARLWVCWIILEGGGVLLLHACCVTVT